MTPGIQNLVKTWGEDDQTILPEGGDLTKERNEGHERDKQY